MQGKKEIKAIVVGNVHVVDSMNMSEAFRNMRNLRLLYFHAMTEEMSPCAPAYLPNELRWLTWNYFNQDSLPKTFNANKLVGLEMPHSNIVQLWTSWDVKVQILCYTLFWIIIHIILLLLSHNNIYMDFFYFHLIAAGSS